MISLGRHANGLVLPVVVQPGARRNAILGERAGALRVAVTAAPDRGKANDAIQSVLADCLDCKAARITLLTGATSRRKQFLVGGIDEEELGRRLDAILRESGSSNILS